jgi:TPR repeat protein
MIIMPGAASTEKAAVIAATPAIVPTEAPVSPADVSALLQHGDALLATGDIASARLFYEKAAMAGDAMAALRLGETYDSLFLTRAGLTGVHGDRAVAARWYRRASELGASEADVLLKSTEDGQD